MKRAAAAMSFAGILVVLLLVLQCHRADAAPPKIITVPVSAGGQGMAARTDAEGAIHLLIDTADGPQYVNSRDQGKTLSQPVPLVDDASRKPGLEFGARDMAVAADGTVHVALGTNAWKLKLPEEEWGFFYTRKLPGQAAFTPLRNVNHKPSEGFSLAANESGVVTAVWMADKLFANVSHDGGETFLPTVEVDARLDPCNCCTTSSTYGPDGRLAILYREETNNDRDMYLALWDQERNEVTKTRVSTTAWNIDACPMTYFSIARSGSGFVAAWPTKGQIYFARLNADGSPKPPKEVRTPGSNGMRTGILAIPASDGRTLVAWKKEDDLGWQLYDARGQAVGAPGLAHSAGNGVAGVFAKNGDFVLFR